MSDLGENERRRPEELAVLYSLEPDIRDIFVEGRSDKSLLDWYLADLGYGGLCRVYSISDRIHLDDSELISSGMMTSERNRVIRAAQKISELCPGEEGAVFIADSDFRHLGLDPSPEVSGLIYTDFSDMEAYSLDERVLEKLLRVSFSAPERISAANVISRITPILVSLFLIKACLRDSMIGSSTPLKAVQILYKEADGEVSDGALMEIFRLAYNSGRREGANVSPEFLKDRFLALGEMVAGDLRKFICGHDISALIVAFLKDECRSVFNASHRKALQSPDVLEVVLRGSMEVQDLRKHGLFKELEIALGGN